MLKKVIKEIQNPEIVQKKDSDSDNEGTGEGGGLLGGVELTVNLKLAVTNTFFAASEAKTTKSTKGKAKEEVRAQRGAKRRVGTNDAMMRSE